MLAQQDEPSTPPLTKPSAELALDQVDEDTLPPYPCWIESFAHIEEAHHAAIVARGEEASVVADVLARMGRNEHAGRCHRPRASAPAPSARLAMFMGRHDWRD